MYKSWQERRSAFNHDWLKNQLIVTINGALNIISGRVEDPEFDAAFVEHLVGQWTIKQGELEQLMSCIEAEMSPQIFLDRAPFSKGDEKNWLWLRALVHQLWLSRENIEEKVHDVVTRLDACRDALDVLEGKLSEYGVDTRSVVALRPYVSDLEQWRNRCYQLSEAISRLPSRIRPA